MLIVWSYRMVPHISDLVIVRFSSIVGSALSRLSETEGSYLALMARCGIEWDADRYSPQSERKENITRVMLLFSNVDFDSFTVYLLEVGKRMMKVISTTYMLFL